jgi:hypothetical protein
MSVHQLEPFLPFEDPGHVSLATAFRSTWLTSSIKALRERDLLARYLTALPKDHHDDVLNSVAGVWLPIEVAMAHYAACESLGLSLDEQVAIGRNVTTFAHRTSYSLALRLAKEAGVTPWSGFTIQRRLWQQVWRGGDVGTFKLGPKEARVEVIGWPCAEIPYVRRAMRGVLLGQSELFCKKAYVQEVKSLCSRTTLGYRVSWF